MFKLIDPNDESHFEYLSQMHHLRHKIFYKNLHWRDGIRAYSQMEFDDFDHKNCRYLIRVNEKDRVDACTRLTPTCFPHLLANAFNEYVELEPISQSITIVETSRFCADSDVAPSNIAGLLMAAMLELGMKSEIERYVSLSDARIKPVVLKYGWHARELGSQKKSGNDICVALSYDVNERHYSSVRKKLGITHSLISDVMPVGKSPLPIINCFNIQTESAHHVSVIH